MSADLLGWWRRLRGSATPANPLRCVVLDVETTGLDPHHDRLLAIAAVAVQIEWGDASAGRTPGIEISPGDSFEVVLRQEASGSTHDNILLHGIGVQQQRDGLPPAQALAAFEAFIGAAPLVAFHAAFDRAMLERATRAELGRSWRNDWLDIEHLCAVTHEHVKARALDDWMDHFGITCAQRHQAAADTWAECEVLARVWPKVAAQCRDWRGVLRLAANHRWVRQH